MYLDYAEDQAKRHRQIFMRDWREKLDAFLQNIQKYGKSSLEIEYEQLLIRANNLELKNNSEYFVIDRQYTTEARDRFDLTGFFWDRDGRKRGETVPLCFFELKFALNSDLREVHGQIQRYYNHIVL